MDAQLDEKTIADALAESLTEVAAETTEAVSEEAFDQVLVGALEAVGGELLFKVCVDDGSQSEHVAAAAIGIGGERHFLLLTLPTSGGHLKVETVATSSNPLAGIAESYAGLMDVFKAAA